MSTATATFQPGSLVRGRGREWVVLPPTDDAFVVARPLNGDDAYTALLFPGEVEPADFPRPSTRVEHIGDHVSAGLLRTAMRVGFTSTAGPFRALGAIGVEPRQYQFVPLLMALRMETVRMLIADDVGIGKTVEAGLIAKELLERGEARGLTVLCSPALAEQWQSELRDKFGIEAQLVLPSTVRRLERPLRTDQSLFEVYQHTIVSTDFIKAEHRRAQFLRSCPDLVIVDEAHTCVSASGTGQRQHRHDLLKGVAKDTSRHLLLVTATPHSGKEDAFRDLIGLLKPELAEVDLSSSKGRDLLARHFVQRRRNDIRRYIGEDTPFPKDRETRDADYEMSPAYAEFNADILAYARETVQDTSGTGVQQRVRWWSALALLRSVASSPAAAAATLRARSAATHAETEPEADDLARSTVLDLAEDEAVEGVDATPGADADEETLAKKEKRRLAELAKRADALSGQQHDTKLKLVVKTVKDLLADGYDPIVFCRYIPTAHYVAEELRGALKKNHTVAAVTGELPPAERVARIEELTGAEGRHVLVATDCLSEGVNLQEHFRAVVHYDLAWNPTRHEQREGRVDRFGQRADRVRAVTLYGVDNGIDGLVLDVLIRKHRTIAAQTGVAVPVPSSSDTVLQALVEGVLIRGQQTDQLELDLGITRARENLDREWELLSEKESRRVTKFAQSGMDLTDVEHELERLGPAARDALGRPSDVAAFVRDSVSALGAPAHLDGEALTVAPHPLPTGVRAALGVDDDAKNGKAAKKELVFRRDLPTGPREHVLLRTDPAVRALARYVLESALDPKPETKPPAKRLGVTRSARVSIRTVLLLVRYRFLLTLPGRGTPRTTVVEEARVHGYRPGEDGQREWLGHDEVAELLSSSPDGNILPEQVAKQAQRAVAELDALQGDLDAAGADIAEELREAHYNVRKSAEARVRGLKLVPHDRADVLGAYVYLPAGGSQ
ncbi:helicase-related protein [Streptomonospora litoralis]|uniref:RNA polymerase-associated protein RapA n=1 Tax=Streptomonospora litoralis TaxID=2498135 RepID=A0A4P6Q5T2_9ACTN|nr:helicase-related protein [Streptomonospora litoralis]QBI54369.1 RNA polymerase-associated protein RapA [Streptomonospora litoralis]